MVMVPPLDPGAVVMMAPLGPGAVVMMATLGPDAVATMASPPLGPLHWKAWPAPRPPPRPS
ncbi:hypothetical protein [Dactylosporangium sp. NPDC050588]|uniref:hypothetical protein n=1 Tax=Dactylosporangium sp. NPDC050588 TaxID=3157211 RepID=UPI0033FDA987